MKKASHGLLTAEKVFDIIYIVVFALCIVGFLIAGIFMMIYNVAMEDETQIALFSVGSTYLGIGVGFIFALPLPIIALNFTKKALRTLENAQSKAEARPGAILAIVAGVLCAGFSIPAGVMMICMKDSAYCDKEVIQ